MTTKSKTAQDRDLILAKLQTGPVTPAELRALGVTHPEGRIHELRHSLNVPVGTVFLGGVRAYALLGADSFEVE
jgi:hypothetical protein